MHKTSLKYGSYFVCDFVLQSKGVEATDIPECVIRTGANNLRVKYNGFMPCILHIHRVNTKELVIPVIRNAILITEMLARANVDTFKGRLKAKEFQ